MDFLALVKRVCRESGGISGAGPTTVVGQTGEYLNVVDWVQEAWRQIQTKKDNWLWMRAPATVQTTIGVRSYAPTGGAGTFGLTRFRGWWRNSFRVYKTSVGVSDEQALTWLTYDEFRDYYLFGTQTPGKPLHFCIDPATKSIMLGPVPDDVYTVNGDYQKSTQVLVADVDTPEMPEEHHMLIVYAALKKYARFDAAPEIYDDAEDNYKQGLRELSRTQTPPIEMYNETLVE